MRSHNSYRDTKDYALELKYVHGTNKLEYTQLSFSSMLYGLEQMHQAGCMEGRLFLWVGIL